MSKALKRWLGVALGALSFGGALLPAVGCDVPDPNDKYDADVTPLVIGAQKLTGNFNPFYATGEDKMVVEQTQLSLITFDEAGNVVCGVDQATAARDFVAKTSQENGKTVTTYKFIIKNGVKFSDGTPLTVEDVLFNLYAYLDPLYDGPNTLGDMDIQGIKQYRYQVAGIADEADVSGLESRFVAAAKERMERVLSCLENAKTPDEKVQADIQIAKTLCEKEATELLGSEKLQKAFLEELIALEKTAALKKTGEALAVPYVSGVSVGKTTREFSSDELDNGFGMHLGEEHDFLQVVVNGVDPETVYGFDFSVAPTHYYTASKENAKGVDVEPNEYNFGVPFADKVFFETVLADADKTALPVGAGAYKADAEKGFFKDGTVYLQRNERFETAGEKLDNAEIKYLQYKDIQGKDALSLLKNKEIHVLPTADKATMQAVSEETELLGYATRKTEGYGYVGINANAVPDIEVRQAIMKAMDVASVVTGYFTPETADTLYRSMTAQSWAHPKGENGLPIGPYTEGAYGGSQYNPDKKLICELVESAGVNGGNTWQRKDGVYTCTKGALSGQTLKLTFTLVGEDNPCAKMFEEAATFLNSCGFDVTVKTAAAAPKNGEFAVWATERVTGKDPDLFNVFHKYSTSADTLNWGYAGIYADALDTQFKTERNILNKVAEYILNARETENKDVRIAEYAKALDGIASMYIELPVYQEKLWTVYNKELVDKKTVVLSDYQTSGAFRRIWEVEYN